MGVLVICALVSTVFLYCFVLYNYSYLLLIEGLLPPTDNSIAVDDDDNDNNNNNNNNNNNSEVVERTLMDLPSTFLCSFYSSLLDVLFSIPFSRLREYGHRNFARDIHSYGDGLVC